MKHLQQAEEGAEPSRRAGLLRRICAAVAATAVAAVVLASPASADHEPSDGDDPGSRHEHTHPGVESPDQVLQELERIGDEIGSIDPTDRNHVPPNQGDVSQPSDACFDNRVPPYGGIGPQQNTELGDDDVSHIIGETLAAFPLLGPIFRAVFDTFENLKGGRTAGIQGMGPDQSKAGHNMFTDVCLQRKTPLFNIKIVGVYASERHTNMGQPFASPRGGYCNYAEVFLLWDKDAIYQGTFIGEHHYCV